MWSLPVLHTHTLTRSLSLTHMHAESGEHVPEQKRCLSVLSLLESTYICSLPLQAHAVLPCWKGTHDGRRLQGVPHKLPLHDVAEIEDLERDLQAEGKAEGDKGEGCRR